MQKLKKEGATSGPSGQQPKIARVVVRQVNRLFVRALVFRANRLFKSGKPERAYPLLISAARKHPDPFKAALLEARVLVESGKPTEAHRVIIENATKDPISFSPFTSLLSRHEPEQPKGTVGRPHLPGSERARTVLSEELMH